MISKTFILNNIVSVSYSFSYSSLIFSFYNEFIQILFMESLSTLIKDIFFIDLLNNINTSTNILKNNLVYLPSLNKTRVEGRELYS